MRGSDLRELRHGDTKPPWLQPTQLRVVITRRLPVVAQPRYGSNSPNAQKGLPINSYILSSQPLKLVTTSPPPPVSTSICVSILYYLFIYMYVCMYVGVFVYKHKRERERKRERVCWSCPKVQGLLNNGVRNHGQRVEGQQP